jgi:hypothetical protein
LNVLDAPGIFIVAPMLPTPQYGLFKVFPVCGYEHPSLVPKVCVHDRWMVKVFAERA